MLSTAVFADNTWNHNIRFVENRILENDFREYGQKVIDDFAVYASDREGWTVADDSREGVRVSFGKDDGDGWFLLRLSVHDPIMPLNVESDSTGGVDIILNKLMTFLKSCNGLEV